MISGIHHAIGHDAALHPMNGLKWYTGHSAITSCDGGMWTHMTIRRILLPQSGHVIQEGIFLLPHPNLCSLLHAGHCFLGKSSPFWYFATFSCVRIKIAIHLIIVSGIPNLDPMYFWWFCNELLATAACDGIRSSRDLIGCRILSVPFVIPFHPLLCLMINTNRDDSISFVSIESVPNSSSDWFPPPPPPLLPYHPLVTLYSIQRDLWKIRLCVSFSDYDFFFSLRRSWSWSALILTSTWPCSSDDSILLSLSLFTPNNLLRPDHPQHLPGPLTFRSIITSFFRHHYWSSSSPSFGLHLDPIEILWR